MAYDVQMSGLPELTETSFAGKVSIVTGGGSGIGAAVADHLSKLGSRVVVVDTDEKGGESIADSVGCDFIKFDVADIDVKVKHGQVYNHFPGNRELTTKAGLAKNLWFNCQYEN